MKKLFLLPLLMMMIFLVTGCGGNNSNNNSANAETKTETKVDDKVDNAKDFKSSLKITMLNVGQGDSFLIQTSKQNILIDTSDSDERSKLVSEIKLF